MKLSSSLIGVLLFVVFIAGSSCNRNNSAVEPDSSTATEIPALFKASTGGTIWADCKLFGTVGTPAHFKPDSDPFDELYNVEPAETTFLNGVTAISESKPGDRDYNGGRWHVNVLKEGVPLDKYLDACSVDDLDLNDFKGTTTYFECPLLPRHGNN